MFSQWFCTDPSIAKLPRKHGTQPTSIFENLIINCETGHAGEAIAIPLSSSECRRCKAPSGVRTSITRSVFGKQNAAAHRGAKPRRALTKKGNDNE